jgi:hypothetical protein
LARNFQDALAVGRMDLLSHEWELLQGEYRVIGIDEALDIWRD